MAAAQQLLDLGNELTDVAAAIAAFVAVHTDPNGPTDPGLGHLSDLAASIAVRANDIERTAIEALAADVRAAITDLDFQVGQAENAIARIDRVQKVLDIASAVLAAAASVAASAGTGNWIGTASAVVTLAQAIHGTLSPAAVTDPG